MASILHISDLHLGDPAEWQYLDSHRSRIAAGDRRAQKDVLRETLTALVDDGTMDRIDAVVVSGDLTNRSGRDGFDEFAALAQTLVDHVPAERVLVVPGNHDVPWEPGPDDPGRYEEFLRVTRENGLATPLFDHRDFEPNGGLTDEGTRYPHLVGEADFVIVPVNSSHFCWGKEPLQDSVAEDLLRLARPELEAAVDDLRRHDVARVSNAQIAALQELLRIQDAALLRNDADDRARIAVLHHQLLPVGAREEFKSFESLTNLGAVRELFAALRIDVVLHGHKHDSALYWDYVADQTSLAAPPHRLLVSAAPGQFIPGEPVMRVLELGGRVARDIRVVDIVAARHTVGALERSTQIARLWASPEPDQITDAMTVRGASVSETYSRIQSLFDYRTAPLNDLVCEVADPSDAGQVPDDYPHPNGLHKVQAWMDDLVEWWQLREPRLLEKGTFNHGERLYRRWGDQVKRAAEALTAPRQEPNPTTRAVLVLVDPEHEASTKWTPFPSFVLVQLQLVPDGATRRLDCTGYFRKQEMRYWWPINVAELAQVQNVVKDLVAIGQEAPVVRGRLRTITAQALVEERLPAVAMPAIDRALDQKPDAVWRMAFVLHSPDLEDKAELRATWDEYLAELDPGEDTTRAPRISHQGLSQVLVYLEWLRIDQTAAAGALRDLVSLYALIDDPGDVDREELARQAAERLAALRTELDAALGPAGGS